MPPPPRPRQAPAGWEHRITIAALVAALVGLDQLLKQAVAAAARTFDSGPLRLGATLNPHSAFSLPLLPNQAAHVAVGVAALLLFTYLHLVSSHARLRLATGLIIAGGISNLLDRLRAHGIIDIITIVPLGLAFNAADVLLGLGSLILLWHLARPGKIKAQ